MSPAVRCGGLERRFGDRLALAGVDLEVGEGQVVLLTGPNGLAGEWGHNPLPWADADDGPPARCYCGHDGCIVLTA